MKPLESETCPLLRGAIVARSKVPIKQKARPASRAFLLPRAAPSTAFRSPRAWAFNGESSPGGGPAANRRLKIAAPRLLLLSVTVAPILTILEKRDT